MEKKRIEWIDTAKGFCIILVVVYHIFCWTGTLHILDGTNINNALQTFRMPLYFTLSGLFFKTYDGFGIFIEKKTNKLIVPFCFFYLISIFIISPNWFQHESTIRELFFDFYDNHCSLVNEPLWFLLCLFEMNVLFYFIHVNFKKQYFIFLVSLLLGGTGLLLSIYKMELPCNLDTAFTAMPFFCIGYLFRKYGFLDKKIGMGWFQVSLCVIGIIIIYIFAEDEIFIRGVYKSIYSVYPLGLIGVVILLYLSQQIGKIRYVSYLGRYSIIILCTHYFIIMNLYNLYMYLEIEKIRIGIFLCNVLFWPLMYYMVIPLCLKYIPWFVAQKDIIRFTKSKR